MSHHAHDRYDPTRSIGYQPEYRMPPDRPLTRWDVFWMMVLAQLALSLIFGVLGFILFAVTASQGTTTP